MKAQFDDAGRLCVTAENFLERQALKVWWVDTGLLRIDTTPPPHVPEAAPNPAHVRDLKV